MATSATTKTTRTHTAPAGDTAAPAAPEQPSTPPAPDGEDATVLWTEQLDPRTLLLDGNIRSDADLDPEFVASIREHGVLQPIVATRTEQGLRVRYGQRRTLAAIKAGRSQVPVVVIDCQDSDETERITAQWHENEHRRGLSVSDRVSAAEQLAAFGLSADQIGAKLGTKKGQVANALAIAKSELARKAAPRYDLTLDQAAAVAEFESDTEVVKALIVAAKEGPVRFEHALERARSERATAERVAAITAELAEKGVRVLDRNEVHAAKAQFLDRLTADPATRKPITPAKHKRCPGHAAHVQVLSWKDSVEAVYVCTDWKTYGHLDRYVRHDPDATASAAPTEAEVEAAQEAARQERRRVIQNNKAWDSAMLTAPRRSRWRGCCGRGAQVVDGGQVGAVDRGRAGGRFGVVAVFGVRRGWRGDRAVLGVSS